LQDLVSYNDKHNDANGEGNRDGNNNNRSWNCGAEGPTEDPNIQALRAKQKRNFLATLLLSQGVPMMYAGDAIGHSQKGNNNAYCQDNEISWLSWDLRPEDRDLLTFVQRMISLRKRHPVFRRRRFFQGRPIKGAEVKDVLWLNSGGHEMGDEEWKNSAVHCLGMFLSGLGLDEIDERGRKVSDTDFLVLLNSHYEDVGFTLPTFSPGSRWIAWMDTSREKGLRPADTHEAGAVYPLQARSLVVLMERHLDGRKEEGKEEANEAAS
jgi:glycogen operon protein